MMKNKIRFFSYILIFLISKNLFADDSKYVIAAQKFEFTKGYQVSAVGEAASEMFPVGILEKLGSSLDRAIFPNEKLDRKRFELQKDRITLYASLASEYKKRDSLFLNNYSDFYLKRKLKESEKAIKQIQDKIDANLAELKTAEEQCEAELLEISGQNFTSETEDSNSELKKYAAFFKHIFYKDEDVVTFEDINFYKNDYTTLFSPSDSAKNSGYTSYAYEKEVVSAKINTMITGKITNYGDYFSVMVTAYSYPGCKNIGTVMEIGTLQESDLLVENLARQLIPLISNSLPVMFNLDIYPKDTAVQVYIDDVIHDVLNDDMVINSGVHSLQFVSEGFKTCRTNYYFEGNKKYNIEVNLEPLEEGFLMLGMLKPLDGIIYTNGIPAEEITKQKSKIKINGNNIIGEFVSENGESAFYYVPEKYLYDNSFVYINPKAFDRNEYLEKRRKIMYGSYSLLITSLIPSFYVYGKTVNAVNLFNLYNNENIECDYDTKVDYYNKAYEWQNRLNICSGISIGLGTLFVYELVRYLVAANTVLPQEAKVPNQNQIKKINMSDISLENNLQEETDLDEPEITDENNLKVEIEKTEEEKTE